MKKTINTEEFKIALSVNGLNQRQLASTLGVTPQSVTNWLKGKDFPRPATLLKLAGALNLSFEQLVTTNDPGKPIIAFRKKAGAKTTDKHIAHAQAIGMLLKPLVKYLPEQQALRTLITTPTTDYKKLQVITEQTRQRVGIGQNAELKYEDLISEFKKSGAILVPVLWGKQHDHKNALHIRLPEEDVTFVFINLDTHIEDFKFWMAHELAHVFTPSISGKIEGEDFADAFAGALLFPRQAAENVYHKSTTLCTAEKIIDYLMSYAEKHLISINTVYHQVNQYAKSINAEALPVHSRHLHAVRNSNAGPLLSEALFDPPPPAPKTYLASCENAFQTDFFHALKRMVREQDTGSSYLQQILDISIHDAKALYEALRH